MSISAKWYRDAIWAGLFSHINLYCTREQLDRVFRAGRQVNFAPVRRCVDVLFYGKRVEGSRWSLLSTREKWKLLWSRIEFVRFRTVSPFRWARKPLLVVQSLIRRDFSHQQRFFPGTCRITDDPFYHESFAPGVVVFHVWFDDSPTRVNANVAVGFSWCPCFCLLPLPHFIIVMSVIFFSCWLLVFLLYNGSVSLGREGIVMWLLHLHFRPPTHKN